MDNLMHQLRGPSDGVTDPFAILEMDECHDRYPVYDEQTHWKMRKPKVGEKYANIEKLKECLTYYSLANGFSLWFYRSSSTELIARCGRRKERVKDVLMGKQCKHAKYPSGDRNEGSSCRFRCYGRKMNTEGSFQVISMVDEHKCVRNFRYENLVNYKWIANHFGHKIRQNPSIKLHEIADMVMKKYKCIVSPEQCKNEKCKAMNEGDHTIKEHYAMIRSYGKEILDSNIGSTVKLGVTVNPDDKTYFDRFYCCFNGLKKGFQLGCRPVIALDGCFLKKPFVGEILTAVGRDGNNHIFPIAWAVVNVENKDNWSWFLELLGDDIGMPNGSDLTLISDQHKGLIEAVKDVMPNAEHRQCARHIYEGFRKKYSGVEFRELFWAASKASYPQLFNKIMAKIKKANPDAHEYLIKKDPKTWSRAFFRICSNCDSVENGFSECFNSVLLQVRNKPLITMLESMRVIVMERLNTMRLIMAKWPGDICPNIQKRLELNKDKQRFWHVIPAGGNLFEVRNGSEAFTVDEEKHTCTCRMWQLAGLPCPHSIVVIFKLNKHAEEYIPDCYRKDSFYKAYHQYLSPIGGMSFWPDSSMYSTVLAPTPKRMPRRPRKLRRRAFHENQLGNRVSRAGTPKQCQNCYEQGHNRSTCQNPKVYPPPKEAPIKGRPRKSNNRAIETGETSRPHLTPVLHRTNTIEDAEVIVETHEVNGSNDYNFVNVRRPEPSVGRPMGLGEASASVVRGRGGSSRVKTRGGSTTALGIKRGVDPASVRVGRARGGSSMVKTRGGSITGLGIRRGVDAASVSVGRARGGSSMVKTRGGSSIGLGIKRGVGATSASVGRGRGIGIVRGRGRQNVGVKYGRLSQWFGLQDETCQHGKQNDNILTQQSQVGANTLSQQLQVEPTPNTEGVSCHTDRPRSARLMQKILSRTRTDDAGSSSSKNHEYY